LAVEDFTTYTEVDVPADHIQFTGTNRIDHAAYRDEDTYLYDDKGVAHFGDFTHKVDIRSDFQDNDWAGGSVWMLSNHIEDRNDLHTATNPFIGVMIWGTNANRRIYLEESTGAGAWNQDWCNINANTWYYLLIKKTGVNLICGIYSTAALRNAGDGTDGDVCNLAIVLDIDYTFRYVYACNSHNDGKNWWANNYVENLDLQENVSGSSDFNIAILMNDMGLI
jgi:hypothetical protein